MWTVILASSDNQEYLVLDKFNTKANAQLYAEEYVEQYIVNNDGAKTNLEFTTRAGIDKIITDVNCVKEDRHFIIRNQFPWGLTVNRVIIKQLETNVFETIEVVETQMVDEIIKTSKDVTTYTWFGRQKQKIQDEQLIKVAKPITVNHTQIKTIYNRVVNTDDIFTVTLLYDKSNYPAYFTTGIKEQSEKYKNDSINKTACNKLAAGLNQLNTFLDIKNNSCKLSDVKFKYPFEFDKSSTKSVKPFDLPLAEIKWAIEPKRASVSAPCLTKASNVLPPPVSTKPSSLMHLNNDILARHREMFGNKKRAVSTLDDDTIMNLCDEIERAIQATEDKNDQFDLDLESDSESDYEDEISIYDPDEI